MNRALPLENITHVTPITLHTVNTVMPVTHMISVKCVMCDV